MRHIVCVTCAKEPHHEYDRHEGVGRARYDPGWTMRVVRGKAKQPQAYQRVITITTTKDDAQTVERNQLPLDHFNCDSCNAQIQPGDVVYAVSLYRDDRVLADWESEYLEPYV